MATIIKAATVALAICAIAPTAHSADLSIGTPTLTLVSDDADYEWGNFGDADDGFAVSESSHASVFRDDDDKDDADDDNDDGRDDRDDDDGDDNDDDDDGRDGRDG